MVNNITLEVNGENYGDLLSYSIEKSIENLCGTFSVEATATDEFGDNPIKPNDAIVVAIDGEPVITGFVDEQEVMFDAGSHKIKLTGRDKTSDFVDSTLDAKAFNPPIGFEELLKKLLILVGYEVVNKDTRIGLDRFSNKISIINTYGPIAKFTTSEGIQLRQSESAFQLIKRCAEKRQLIFNTDGNGNIVIRSIGDELAITVLQNVKQTAGLLPISLSYQNNNIKNVTVKRAFQGRFNKYVVRSQTTQGSAANVLYDGDNSVDPLPNNAVPQSGVAYDNEVRATRIFTSIASSSMTSNDCKKRAEWEGNLRRVNGFTYCCEVFGFRQNLDENLIRNPLWAPNQLVYVIDTFAGIQNELLIKSVNYTQDLKGGSITKLELVEKDAYTTSLFEPLLKKKVDNIAGQSLLPGTE